MNFLDDPRRAEIEPMHEFLEMWGDYYRDRQRLNVSITYLAMMAIRNNSKRREQIREGIAIGEPIKLPKIDRSIIATKVEELITNSELWRFHERDRQVLVDYYLNIHPSCPIGKVAKILGCKPYRVEALVKDALYVFSKLWKD